MIGESRATDVLLRCRMPAHEIRWILASDDPAVVHMLVELHGERLREELTDRLRALDEVEARLTGASPGPMKRSA